MTDVRWRMTDGRWQMADGTQKVLGIESIKGFRKCYSVFFFQFSSSKPGILPKFFLNVLKHLRSKEIQLQPNADVEMQLVQVKSVVDVEKRINIEPGTMMLHVGTDPKTQGFKSEFKCALQEIDA